MGLHAGLLVWSVHCMQEQQHVMAALLFAVLLNMKHLFVYGGPVYFVYLLRSYCVGRRALRRFLMLGAVVAGVTGASFGPFIALGQMSQVRERGSRKRTCAAAAARAVHASSTTYSWLSAMQCDKQSTCTKHVTLPP